MNFLIGWMIGERVSGAVGIHNRENGGALWGLLIWAFIGWLGGATATYNIGKTWSGIGSFATVAIVLAFCAHHPLTSGFKQMMLNAVAYAAGSIMVLSGGYVVIRIGYAIVYGKLKARGLAALPLSTLMQGGMWFVCAFVAAFGVGAAIRFDRFRIGRENDSLAPKTADAKARYYAAEEAAPRYERAAPPPSAGAPVEDTWWTVLEVSPDATKAECEAKGRELLKQYHPDLWMTAPPRLKIEAERQTRCILKALQDARAARKAA